MSRQAKFVRKDYGCPLRIYYDRGAALPYCILPPRSRRAMQWREALTGRWRGIVAWAGGSGQYMTCVERAGPHLGQRIHWRDVPPAVQAALRNSFLSEYCPKEG